MRRRFRIVGVIALGLCLTPLSRACVAAQDFPPGWTPLARPPIKLSTGDRMVVHVAQSHNAGAFLFITEPLAARSLGAGWKAIRERLLGRAVVRQDLGTQQDARGERRTRVVEGRIVAADGKARRAFGEAQLIVTPTGGFLVGFLNAQDGGETPETYEEAARWVAAAAPAARVAAAPRPPAVAPSPPVEQEPAPGSREPPPAPAAPPNAPGSMAAPGVRDFELVPGQPTTGWRKTNWAGGSADFVAFDPGGLTVDYPPDSRPGGAGAITTTTPVVIGDPERGARLDVSFDFDKSATLGYLAGLCGARADNCFDEPGIKLFWQPASKDAPARLLLLSRDGNHRTIPITGAQPGRITLRLDKDGVAVSGDNTPEFHEKGLGGLRAYSGMEVFAQAIPVPDGARARLKLAKIRVEQIDGAKAEASAGPATPNLFAGSADANWLAYGRNGGDFAAFAHTTGKELRVETPAKREQASTGVTSARPIVMVPARADAAPRRLTVTVDPARTTSFVTALSTDKEPGDPFLGSKVWAHWRRAADGGGWLTMNNCASPTRIYELRTPPGWGGVLQLLLSPGFVEARLDDNWRVGGPSGCVDEGWRYHVSVFAQAPEPNQPATLALREIRVDRALPARMTEPQRFEFMDDADFDPAEFLGQLGRATKNGAK